MKTESPKVAVIGSGYWGKNLVRVFHALEALAGVCDVDQGALTRASQEYGVRTTQNVDEVLKDDGISGVVIAAPAAQHFDLTRRALLRGKDVFVEKSLALRAVDGRELVELAAARHRILQVGHILEFHPAISELKRLIGAGELGRIQYIYSSRLNLGKLRTEENILWSFAPHDISAILFLLNEIPARVSSQGGSFLSPPLVDTTLSTLDFPSGVKAHIFVSWLHPFKEQKLAIVGSEKMAVFDDVRTDGKLMLYSHRINWLDRKPIAQKDAGHPVTISTDEPLRLECEHFLESVRTRRHPRTDGESALRVLEVLEGCERSLRDKGAPAQMEIPTKRYFAHSTAVIDEPCEIGDGAKIWHFSHVMAGSRLGRSCNLGQNVVVSPGVRIGDNVKIQNNVSIYAGVELEDDVFCGPSMVFTNVINPRSHVVRRHEYQKTLVKRGASLGANSTIVCGTTIGRYAFIAAGAVVTHDIPDYALVMGVPGKQAGWMCACGVRLQDGKSTPKCTACGKEYSIEGATCREVEAEGVSPLNLVSTGINV
ncbi:MAG TPA: Gfo/Idh/MocA family oxidoreductase [Candidatus Acidoferrales bacterium]|nr:Gfo/Idh/MocA family oxidoreductase [Candidatus Acidoferrales bacterium]